MRFSLLAGLAGLSSVAYAQSSDSTTDAFPSSTSAAVSSTTTSTVVPISSSTTTSAGASTTTTAASTTAAATSTTTGSVTALTVGPSAAFTAINAAVAAAQNSAVPSVVVQAGTYSEQVIIQGTQTVTIVGPSASSYAGNQVLLTSANTAGTLTFNTQHSKGVTFKNINITSTAATGAVKAPAVSMYGSNMAFYSCALISTGTTVFTASVGGGSLIANSYVEGYDKLFYGYVTAYVYGSTIVPLAASANIYFGQGYASGGVNQNSTFVVDSSSVVQKSGYTNTYVSLGSPNGNYVNVIYRNTALGSFIAPIGVSSTTCSKIATFGEFQNTGAGAMTSSNAASRNTACDISLTAAQVSSYTIDQVFGNGFTGYSSSDLSWVDSGVLSSLQKSDAAQLASASTVASSTTSSTTSASSTISSATSASTTTSSASSDSSTTSPVSASSSTTDSASSGSSTTSPVSSAVSSSSTASGASMTSFVSSTMSLSSTASGSSSNSTTPVASSTTSSLASSSASTTQGSSAVTVATDGSAQFTDVNAAITFAQASGIPTVSVLAGTYSPVAITGTQTVTVAGPTATSFAQNQVVFTAANAVGVLTFGTSASKGVTFRNLNFTNTAAGNAPAVSMKGINMGFYGCALISTGALTYSSSQGLTIISDSYIEGTDKLFYNYPTVYLFRSTIVPTASGTSVFFAKGLASGGVNYNSTIIVDSSSVVAKPGSTASNVYLATPNGAFGYLTAIYRNSAIGSLIAAGGYYSTACTVVGTFGEFQNTGAGAYASNSAARATNCDVALSASQVSAYTIDKVFANAFPGFTNADTTWIDATVLSAIQSSDSAQVASYSASATSSSTASSASGTLSGTSTSVNTTQTASGTSTATSATCATPTPGATLVVSLNATGCQYSNVTAALNALPNDSKSYTISIQPGTYTEQLSITRNGKVTLVGNTTYVNDYTQNAVTINFSSGQLTSAGKDEITPVINAKKTNDNSGLALYNINFVNTYPQTSNTAALAGDFYGANIAAYGCSFVGFQDTLLANKGTQVFSNCYIEGSIDFIWGFSTAYFHQCYIATNTKGACVAAQSRAAGTVSGYVFDSCYVTYTSTYGSAFGLSYLGRPYSSYSTVIYKNSFIDKHINAAGWNIWSTSAPQTDYVTFGEYNNTGPGSWQAGTARASFATNMTDGQVAPYTLSSWIGDTSFLDMTAYNYAPSFSWNASTTSTSSTGTTTKSGSTTTASVNAHPDSGTVPPQYAVLVSPNGQVNGSFSNVTAALASLPSDNTNQTVFIYAGSYNEQIPSINRPGAVRLVGYTTGNPGQSYKDNQVTITFARGLSVSPLPTGHSDAETATVATASNRISFYNINIINTDNVDGLEASYVTLAASIYGNDIGFYACSFNGWQDTLLNGATAGYQYYESCYIGGAIDFIWGYSKAYFKGCTIGAKKAKSAMTAQSRASSSAVGGYIFDQCLFTAAPDATVSLTNTVFLGRPYSAYALVIVKNSYIDSVISPSGWKVWSATDPRTDHITFAEYNNVGPSNWENNAAARLAFGNATLLTSDTYSLASVMDSTSWIDMTYWSSITTPQPAVVNTTTAPAANITATGSASYNGTTPPSGALIVSKNPIAGQTVYGSIQAAINAAPTSSKTNATIFIYPGVYQEKLIVNKSGTTIFMGYSDTTEDYSKNQVTIQQSFGVDTQGTGSDVDAATVYAMGNYFYAYNINFRNNNGTQQDIASLGFAVQSSKYAFMSACQIYGNQDTLYVSGYLMAFKTYVEGNIDFIFGAGSGYFLSSTISPNEDGDSITAAKRATNTTQAGFVFDQCTITPANGATGYKNVSLGRPWNNFANVAYIGSYLDGSVGAAGWDIWSKSAPQTNGVSYGEYHNYGPGASICNRASFSQQLTDTSVVQYQLSRFFASTSWIDFSVIDVSPFTVGIGSAQTCSSAVSSTVSATILPSLSSTSTGTVPVVTAYVTKTTTDKETLTTTFSAGATTSTSVVVVTENDGTTVTPAPVVKTSVVKATSFTTVTNTQADKTVTVKSTATVYQTNTVAGKTATVKSTSTDFETTTVTGKTATVKTTETAIATTTISGKATTVKSTQTVGAISTIQGKDVTVKSTVTVGGTTTITPAPVTAKATTTTTIVSTSSPKDVTVSSNEGSVVYVVKTVTPKGTTVSSTTTTTGVAATKTSTIKASTSTVSATSVKTVKKSTTVAATCSEGAAARLFRRGLAIRAAAGPTTTTVTVPAIVTSFVKTVTVTSAGQTFYTTVTSTSTIAPSTTLKAATSTVMTTSFATVTSVIAESAATQTITNLATVTSVATQTIAGSTVTNLATVTSYATVSEPGVTTTSTAYATSFATTSVPGVTATSVVYVTDAATQTIPGSTTTAYATVTSQQKETVPASTTTSYKIVSSTQIVNAPQNTVTVLYSQDTTSTSVTTLPASTATVYKTVAVAGPTSVVTVTPAPVVKTTTVKSTQTVVNTVTTTPKNAPACTA